jgi:hypothetical protein
MVSTVSMVSMPQIEGVRNSIYGEAVSSREKKLYKRAKKAQKLV